MSPIDSPQSRPLSSLSLLLSLPQPALMSRFLDFHLWRQAAKVAAYLIGSFALIIIERITRLILTVVEFFVPTFVATWIARHWRG